MYNLFDRNKGFFSEILNCKEAMHCVFTESSHISKVRYFIFRNKYYL